MKKIKDSMAVICLLTFVAIVIREDGLVQDKSPVIYGLMIICANVFIALAMLRILSFSFWVLDRMRKRT